MIPRLALVEAPKNRPITYEHVKEHLRLDTDDDANYLGALVAAATSLVDGSMGILNRALITQKWSASLDRFWPRSIEIPLPPLQSVDLIQYVDTAGVLTTLDPVDYIVSNTSGHMPASISPALDRNWPSTRVQPDAVRIDFTAGYGLSAADVPEALRQGLLFMVAHWYLNREPINIGNIVNQIPLTASTLLNNYRVFVF